VNRNVARLADLECSFRFLDESLNQQLLRLVEKASIPHRVGRDDVIHFAAEEEERIENHVISQLRGSVFLEWQVLSCPPDWVEKNREHMEENDIPYREELIDDQLAFLRPKSVRPHAWKLA